MWPWQCRYGVVEENASLGVAFEVSDAQTRLSVHFLPTDVELSAPSPEPFLPACHHASGHNNN